MKLWINFIVPRELVTKYILRQYIFCYLIPELLFGGLTLGTFSWILLMTDLGFYLQFKEIINK